MEREIVNKVYLKVRDFLNEKGYFNGIGFDIKSYDNENDIPHITYNGEKRNVTFFQARGKETIAVVLHPYWHEVLININDIDTEEFYTLLQDVYYEIDESYEVGDFEINFLKK